MIPQESPAEALRRAHEEGVDRGVDLSWQVPADFTDEDNRLDLRFHQLMALDRHFTDAERAEVTVIADHFEAKGIDPTARLLKERALSPGDGCGWPDASRSTPAAEEITDP